MIETRETREAELRKQNEKTNLDHTVSRMEIYPNKTDKRMKNNEE